MVARREAQRAARNSGLENTRRGPHGASVISPGQERLCSATANPAEGQRPAGLLSARFSFWGLPAVSPAVDAVIPGNPERARLDADVDLVTGLKAIEVVYVDGEALVFLPFAPGVHDEPPRPAHNPRHVVASSDRFGVIHNIFGGIQSAIHKKKG